MVIASILLTVIGIAVSYVLLLWICSLCVSTKKEYRQDSRFYRFLLNSAAWLGIKLLRIHIHVTGMDQLPDDTKVLFISNHRSKFDPILTWYAFRKWKPAFVSKPENFKIPIFGRIIRKCCFLAIDRENPRKALSTINRAAKLLRSQEVSVGVYPEGTRSKDEELLPFHNGVFKIAQKAEAPIVVLSVIGTEQIHQNIPRRRSDVYLDVLEVFPAELIKDTNTGMIGASARRLLETNMEMRKI